MTADAAVLVTRPQGQAGPLLAMLDAAGHRACHQPLLVLEPLAVLPAEQRRYLFELDNYQHVIFISANAVHFGMACIDDIWPQLPVGVNWYAIGATTAALLAGRGIVAIEPQGRMDSEGLLAVDALQAVAGERVLIVKGEGGRGALRDTLTRRGARVDELACYRRRCPALAPGALATQLRDERVGTILISSGEGLDNLLTLLTREETTKFRDIRLIVPSERVARRAREAGFGQVSTAANASDAAMLAALQRADPGSDE